MNKYPKGIEFLTSNFQIRKLESKTQNPLHEDLLFCSLWELRAWYRCEVDLVGSSSGKPWIPVIFSHFCEHFIFWFSFSFCPFGCEVGLSYFIVSALFQLLFLVAVCLEAEN